MSRETSLTIYVVDREGEKHTLRWQPEESMMEALRDNGLPILASCGGVCACATCHVYVQKQFLEKMSARGESEIELLCGESVFRPEVSRLSCQIQYDDELDGITVALASD